MGQPSSLAGTGGSVDRRWSLVRDPLAILTALTALFLLGCTAWWLSQLGQAGGPVNRYTGLIGLPAGAVVALAVIRARRAASLDRATGRMWATIVVALAAYASGAFVHLAALSEQPLAFLAPLGIGLEVAAYPIAWVGLSIQAGPARSTTDMLLLGLDVGIVAWSASMLGWHLLLYPIARQYGASLAETLGVALFPGLDMATLFALAATITRVRQRGTAVALAILGAGVAALFVGDLVSGIEILHGTYRQGGPSGLWFSTTWVFFAFAAYAQWRVPQTERVFRRPAQYGRGQPWLTYVALAVAFVVPLVGSWGNLDLLQQHLPATGLLMALVVARLAVTARDNSRLAAAERERLAVAAEQAAEAIVTTDRHAVIRYVNPAFTRITGYTADDVLGRSMTILRPEGSPDDPMAAMMQAVYAGGTWEGRLEGRHRDGSPYQVAMTVAPLRDPDGMISGAVSVARDVTREQELETELAQSQRMEAVGRLAGGVAHDFNNILTVIGGFSELAAAELPEGHPVGEDIAEIVKASERAASLTRALLAFSRRQVMQAQTLDLNEVVSGMRPMLEVLMGEDVEVVLRPAEKLGLTVADRAQLEQVILNVATNARDAMPDGGRLTISTRNAVLTEKYKRTHVTVKPGPHVALTITDTGVGMTPEVRDHAFEPFFTTKERGKGTGLGLSTVIGVVEQSGGSVQLASRPGAGTELTIFLPRTHGAERAPEAPVEEARVEGGNETILVAEDERALRTFVERILRQAGYRVLTAANGFEALEIARKAARLDLLFTDIVMPNMDGPELASRLARVRPGVPTIFASGYSEQALLQGFGEGERVPYLAKPYTAESLLMRVRETLDSQGRRRRNGNREANRR
jgi:PAS domain S-box-containing protein